MISDKTIGRLSLYRRLLSDLMQAGVTQVYSHELAAMCGGTAAQVRRDVMTIGFSGSPTRGYTVANLVECIDNFLDAPGGTAVALVGVGNLGRALLSYFSGRRPKLSIVATFDKDPDRVNRVICGCRCYPLEDLERIVREKQVRVGIITVPAETAQDVADALIHVGVEGLLNFAPVPLKVPPGVFVEDIDITSLLEKVAYFARQQPARQEVSS